MAPWEIAVAVIIVYVVMREMRIRRKRREAVERLERVEEIAAGTASGLYLREYRRKAIERSKGR